MASISSPICPCQRTDSGHSGSAARAQEPTCGRSAPAICERLFDLEAELIDQCAPLAFLALDVGGVLLRRTGHGPTAVGDQAKFHVVGVDDLAQLLVELLDNRWRRAARR